MFELETEIPEKYLCRLTMLQSQFEKNFEKSTAKWMAKAPGRVNLIGEHIDYCGYGVLPMAIDKSTMMVASYSKDRLFHLTNTKQQYERCDFNYQTLDITKEEFSWAKYLMCGIYAAKEICPSAKINGMNILVDGTVPIGCGLSSSSSLVVCSALIICLAHNINAKKDYFANVCARVERYIGLAGGGMDQAISCLAQEGKALHIKFNPLRTTDVYLPQNGLFVVANSISTCNKALTSQYNTRVVECRLGLRILSKYMKIDKNDEIKLPIDLEEKSGFSKSDLIKSVNKFLHSSAYTRNECMQILDMDGDIFTKEILTPNTLKVEIFYLQQRMLHVFNESERVEQFANCCNQKRGDENTMKSLGSLMNDSHISCKDLYECSSPEQDKLVDVMRKCGCIGARLTGAGWGGSVVGLIDSKKPDKFLNDVNKEFYESIDANNENIFISKPGEGARAFLLIE